MRRWWLPLLCGLLQGVSLSTGPPRSVSPVGAAVASAVGAAAGLALVARSRVPLAVLGASTAAQVAQVLLARPALPVVTAVAAYTVARHVLLVPSGRRAGAALGAAVLAVAGSVAVAGAPGTAAPYALVLVLAVLFGLVRALQATRAADARRELVMGERLRIARDLHDVVGHGVGAITVQAGAARMAVAAGATAEATSALLAIEAAGRSVLREARWMVGLLRDDAARPHLSDVPALVSQARRSGLEVALAVEGDLTAVSDDVGEATYRVVQEGLTNVLRHAGVPAASLRVVVGRDVEVELADEGSGRRPDAADGHGLQGMRERAAALGGVVRAGPGPASGWTVQARLPARART